MMDLRNKLYTECGLSPEDVFQSKHFTIITRSGIEKIQYKKKIHVEFEVVTSQKDFASVKANGVLNDTFIETFGSACEATVKGGNAYYLEMAEKRALSRVVLKLMNMYEYDVLGEDEHIFDTEDATYKQITLMENLLRTSIFDERDKERFESEMNDMSAKTASELIEKLKDNQRDPIQSGDNYSAGDILKSI